jgi:hypothetical protein
MVARKFARSKYPAAPGAEAAGALPPLYSLVGAWRACFGGLLEGISVDIHALALSSLLTKLARSLLLRRNNDCDQTLFRYFIVLCGFCSSVVQKEEFRFPLSGGRTTHQSDDSTIKMMLPSLSRFDLDVRYRLRMAKI